MIAIGLVLAIIFGLISSIIDKIIWNYDGWIYKLLSITETASILAFTVGLLMIIGGFTVFLWRVMP